ncbi:unnamed protein product [Echinostoma caproni]|uniref:Integrase_H2C2 domain-containing protein n=1 Tax=Echinostoma caproni TaxID=27848 RepID=A0A183B6P3_9TREM|nr:unnamed protein product [Echinostoma caproni]
MPEVCPPVDDREPAISFKPVKPRAFIPHDPEVWFAALETQFIARNVRTQRSKYVYAVEAIPGERMCAIRDIILKPPEKGAYDVLKAVIRQFYIPSNGQRLRQLLARHPIGDMKRSRHLARLRSLAGPVNTYSDIVKEHWIESWPLQVQPTVTARLEDS